jgi:hypothetical protein
VAGYDDRFIMQSGGISGFRCCFKVSSVVRVGHFKRITNSTEATDMKNIGIYLYKVRCKWESKASKV